MGTIRLRTAIPGPNSLALIARREVVTARGVARLTDVAVVRAHGAAVEDADGNILLDFAGGIGALALGHCPEPVVAAITAQAERLIHLCAVDEAMTVLAAAVTAAQSPTTPAGP